LKEMSAGEKEYGVHKRNKAHSKGMSIRLLGQGALEVGCTLLVLLPSYQWYRAQIVP
jgi:hypothetical protein